MPSITPDAHTGAFPCVVVAAHEVKAGTPPKGKLRRGGWRQGEGEGAVNGGGRRVEVPLVAGRRQGLSASVETDWVVTLRPPP